MEIDVKVGDVVLFHVNAGIKVSEHKEVPERFLLREEDILAIVI
jgi:co-chaperonin GroES (HSP10)